MKTKALSTYLPSENQLTLEILHDMKIQLIITMNSYCIPINHVFEMAARINKDRGFLFVSKLLGKHIPVNPLIPLLTSGLLAIKYAEEMSGMKVSYKESIIDGFRSEDPRKLEHAYSLLQEQKIDTSRNPIIISFAETATGLGHGLYDLLENAFFVSTTREYMVDMKPTLKFEEEHSHAVDQLCYIPAGQLDNEREIILVDDEITTGKTVLNIIKEIHSTHCQREFVVLSILDWRSDENIQLFHQMEQELDITIKVISLLSGKMNYFGKPIENTSYNYEIDSYSEEVNVQMINLSEYFTSIPYQSINQGNGYNVEPFVKETGRFGLTHKDKQEIFSACKRVAEILKDTRKSEKTLCLGTGEFIYLPMKISSYMGEGISYHSTTRSPIYPVDKKGYGVKNGYRFMNPEDQNVDHFVYNIPKDYYDEVYLFLERSGSSQGLQQLYDICKGRGISTINVITFSTEQKEGDCDD